MIDSQQTSEDDENRIQEKDRKALSFWGELVLLKLLTNARRWALLVYDQSMYRIHLLFMC